MLSSSSSPRLLLVLLATAGGCATVASQPAAHAPSNGVTVVLKNDGTCTTTGTVQGALPNDELCREIVTSLRGALTQRGFTVTGESAPGALNLVIDAVQSASPSSPSADVALQVSVKRAGDEVEVFKQSGEIAPAPTYGQLSAVVRAVAATMATSKRVQAAGTGDKPTAVSAAAL